MPLPFFQATLPNGLTIFAERNDASHSFAAGLFVRTGSRDESASICGVSHFLEHMMFKGSDKYSWEDVNRIFDEIGARYNAFTSQEMTAYYANVLPEFTERAIEHLSHLLRPALRQSDFDTEKNVILEEIAMYLDDPNHRVYEKLMEEHFAGHPLALSVLGTSDTIKALQRDQMANYFSTRYGPGNTILAVSGRFEFEEVVRLAQKYCGHWPAVSAPRSITQPTPAGRVVKLADAKLNRAYTMALAAGPSAQDDRRFAARVLADVVGDSEGSRYYWALVDNAIAEDADFGFYPHDGCGSFYISLTTDPDRSQKALDIALAELRKVSSDLTDDEVTRAKNKIASAIVLSGELPVGRMRALGSQWVYTGQYRSLDDDIVTLASVTPDSIRSLLRDFSFDPMTVVTLAPA
jgi:predicted Zn-dependent peptidase